MGLKNAQFNMTRYITKTQKSNLVLLPRKAYASRHHYVKNHYNSCSVIYIIFQQGGHTKQHQNAVR